MKRDPSKEEDRKNKEQRTWATVDPSAKASSRQVKALQVSYTDVKGGRFNGYDIKDFLVKLGIEVRHLVWLKESTDSRVSALSEKPQRVLLRDLLTAVEKQLSLQSILYPFSWEILYHPWFLEADVVHYHLLLANFFSLASLPLLTRIKPSIWTIHDPWASSGHCIYPCDCSRFESGCGGCPDLAIPPSVLDDNTALNWELKRLFVGNSKLHLVVASQWMKRLLGRSPILREFPVHLIPFGIDLDLFCPGDKLEARKKLGLADAEIVLSFRAVDYRFKGLEIIKKCLKSLPTIRRLAILTFDGVGLIDEFRDRFRVVDLGWVNDAKTMVEAYRASDLFLMPSTAEAFGVMAIEAMACGRPVVGMRGTALEELLEPVAESLLPRDSEEFCLLVSSLIKKPEAAERIGAASRKIAEKQYDIKEYANRLSGLYATVLDSWNPELRHMQILNQLKINASVANKRVSKPELKDAGIDELRDFLSAMRRIPFLRPLLRVAKLIIRRLMRRF